MSRPSAADLNDRLIVVEQTVELLVASAALNLPASYREDLRWIAARYDLVREVPGEWAMQGMTRRMAAAEAMRRVEAEYEAVEAAR